MANYSGFLRRLGMKIEDTRGTAETTADKWHEVLGGSEFNYGPELLPDLTFKGVKSEYTPKPGRKNGDFTLLMPLKAMTLGEYICMLLAAPNSSTQQEATTAYLHTWTPGNGLIPQSYTMFFDRSLAVLKYNLCQVAKIKLSSAPDSFVMTEITGMFKTEASGSIGTPSYTTTNELGFQHVDFKIAGSSNTEVKSWSIELSNNLFRKRTMGLSQDAQDFVPLKNEISGEFTIYFANATERDKFVAGTTSSVELVITGDTIETTYEYTVEILIDDIRYSAFPYDTEDDLLAAKVAFKGFYNLSNTRLYRVRVTNTLTSYPAS